MIHSLIHKPRSNKTALGIYLVYEAGGKHYILCFPPLIYTPHFFIVKDFFSLNCAQKKRKDVVMVPHLSPTVIEVA